LAKHLQHFYRAYFRPDSLSAFEAFDKALPDDGPGLGYAQVWHKGNVDSYAVANEYVAGRLGQMIGLPIPPFAITYYDKKPLFSSLDFNFERAKLPPIDPQSCVDKLPSLSAGVLVFDIWIANEDRWENNLLADRVTEPRLLVVFDHHQSLLFGYREEGILRLKNEREKLGICKRPISGGTRPHCLQTVIASSQHLFPWITRISKVPNYFIKDTCDHVRELGVSKEESQELREFLVYRRDTLEGIIKQNQGSFPLIADWPWQGDGLLK